MVTTEWGLDDAYVISYWRLELPVFSDTWDNKSDQGDRAFSSTFLHKVQRWN